MRIIAGEYRSRSLKSLSGDNTRPTSDKIKEAIFSRIGPYFDGGMMLDLFGGSGNMGLEAISRGMEHVVFCESYGPAYKVIQENINGIQVESQCTCLKMDYHRALEQCKQKGMKFDFIYLDPPYKKKQISEIITYVIKHHLLAKHGNIICESLKEDVFEDSYEDLYKMKEATYGITRITYYQRRESNDENSISRDI